MNDVITTVNSRYWWQQSCDNNNKWAQQTMKGSQGNSSIWNFILCAHIHTCRTAYEAACIIFTSLQKNYIKKLSDGPRVNWDCLEMLPQKA